MPIVPVEVTIQGLHRRSPTHHECVSPVDVVWPINVITDLLGRMFRSVKVLTPQVSQAPVFGQLAHVGFEVFHEFGHKAGIVEQA